MRTLEIISAQFTGRNWNLRTLPHHLRVISTLISRLATTQRTLHFGLSTFVIWTATFPPIQLTVFITPRIYISQPVRYARICTSKVDFINRLRGLSLRLRQQGFETNLLQKSFNKFFSRHGLIVEKYGAALREMRLAIQAWIAPSYPYITYLLLRVVFQLYLGMCAGTILFWASALFVYLFNWRVHLVR